jgi:hypothetical protein
VVSDDGNEAFVLSTRGGDATATGSDNSGVADIKFDEVEEVEVAGVNSDEVEIVEVTSVKSDEIEMEDLRESEGGSVPPISDVDESDGPVDDVIQEVEEIEDEELEDRSRSKRKRRNEFNQVNLRWKIARREGSELSLDRRGGAKTDDDSRSEVEASDEGSGVEIAGKRKRGRSSIARRKLKDRVSSGNFIVNEQKRRNFEEKCTEVDSGAQFDYEGTTSWRVRHSKCLNWYAMSEPYNATKFRKHAETCKSRHGKGNMSITNYFKPKDAGETEAKSKITASGRNQIVVGASTASTSKSIELSVADNGLIAQSHPCGGISSSYNPLVSTYISRTVVEGAGSVSLHKATEMVYGPGIAYSELQEGQKSTVVLAQSHSRRWSINRELQVVFSTDCEKFVEGDRHLKAICENCEKVARSDAFKRALRVKPVPLGKMKFIPIKYRGPMEDLGAKFAGARGLSELLQDVSCTSNCGDTPTDV